MDKTKGKTIGLLAMVVVVTIYGVSYISRAVISEYLPTVVILVIQMAVMTILFTGFNLVTGKNIESEEKGLGHYHPVRPGRYDILPWVHYFKWLHP